MYSYPLCLNFCFTELECLVWILGHSYVFWGAKRAAVRLAGRQLGFPGGVNYDVVDWSPGHVVVPGAA